MVLNAPFPKRSDRLANGRLVDRTMRRREGASLHLTRESNRFGGLHFWVIDARSNGRLTVQRDETTNLSTIENVRFLPLTAHRPALAHHDHRATQMGAWVMINEGW